MSAWRSSTLARPASSTRRVAAATDSSEMSTDVIRASGLRAASVTVCAPTPQPASSTVLPGGYEVSPCSSSTSVPAWSANRSPSRSR